MKRWVIFTSILALFLGVFSWGGYRLLWTPDGVRWVLRTVSYFSGIHLQAEKVQGRLAGALHLEGLEASWSGGRLRVDRLTTRLLPGHLLRGRMIYERISADRILIEDHRPKSKILDLTLPRIAGFLTRLDLEARSFALDRILYRRLNESPVEIKRVTGRLAWKQGALAVDPLEMEGEPGRIRGSIGLGFIIPALQLDLLFVPEKPLPLADQIAIQAKLKEARRPEQLAGPISIRSRQNNRERLLFQADLGMAPRRISLKSLFFQENGRKGAVKGESTISFETTEPAFLARLNLDTLDLSPELSFPASLSGDLALQGTSKKVNGTFTLENRLRTWQAFRLDGSFHGQATGVEILLARGDWLKGQLKGQVGVGWENGFSVRGNLEGRNLQPEVFDAGWKGNFNLDVQGKLNRLKAGPPQADLTLQLLESQFQGKSLKGDLKADLRQENLSIQNFNLHGPGIRLFGQGILSRKLDFEGQIDDLSLLLPESRGQASLKGWVRWRQRKLGGQLTFQGRDVFWQDLKIKDLDLKAGLDEEKKDTALDLKARGRKLVFHSFPVDSVSIEGQGTLARQRIVLAVQSPEGKLTAQGEGAYDQGQWTGTLSNLFGAIPLDSPFHLQAPAPLTISAGWVQWSPLVLIGSGDERLTLSGDLGLKPLSGFLGTEWQRFNLARLRPFLRKPQPRGQTSGTVQARLTGDGRLELKARSEMKGSFQWGRQPVDLTRAALDLAWDHQGLRSSWDLAAAEGGRVWGEASSTDKGRLAFPAQGQFETHWEDFELTRWKTKIPDGLSLQGRLAGRIQGQWKEGPRWNLTGVLKWIGGSLAWENKEAALQARVRQADLGISWQEEALRGDLRLELEEYGRISGEFSLPLPSRFPMKIQPAGPLRIGLQGQVRESGLLAALFPQVVRASRGQVQGKLSAKGTWGKPVLEGELELSEAGADLPALGLRLQEVTANASFQEDRINLTSLGMKSGPGRLKGEAAFWLKDWKIIRLQGKLKGQDFQMANLPGFQTLGSPDLDFSGPPEQLTVTGVLKIPEALLSGSPATGVKRASPDVRILDAPKAREPGRVFPIRGEIHLVLGEKVRLKAEGLDTLLRGNPIVRIQNSRDLKAYGEIQTVQGSYNFQGQKLEIRRGRFVFNGPPDNPALDLLALRIIRGRQRLEEWVDEVQAGITMTGPLRTPLIKLYSQPPLSETDILSYILFGEPARQGAGSQDLALLGKAAKFLYGTKMEGNLARRLGLDVIDIQSDGGEVSRSLVTVGKYLDPRLYLGIGGSLFNNSYQLILRYSLTPHLELETKGGTESGGGIFFKVDFE
jgi:translocation and assembly module TamB